MSRICIDIGSNYIHIASGNFQKDNLTVQKGGSFELPSGCLEDEAVADDHLLAEVIKKAFQDGGFGGREIVLTLNATHSIIREIGIPPVKSKDIDNMISSEMQQTFHILNTDIIQYKKINKSPDDTDDGYEKYRVAAIDKDFIEGYYRVAEQLGTKNVIMDININAVDKLLSWADRINEVEVDEKGMVFIDFGHKVTTVYIYAKGQPLFYRHLNIGSADIDNILMDSHYKSKKEAREIKETTDFFEQGEGASAYSESLRPFFYHMVEEVRKLSAFYINRTRNSSVTKCFLFGQGSNLLGFPEYFSSGLGLPVEMLKSVGRGGSNVTLANAGHLNAIAGIIRLNK